MSDKNKYNDEELDKYFSDKNYRQKKLRKKKTENNLIRSVLILFIIGLSVVCGYLFILSKSLPSLAELENPKIEEASKIYSSDGELIDKF
ncbi:MAG: penicillin-binding protein, partial [Ignavibacteria bacterium]|nr:penicillin-binding protein [Ignavibacteria bacterium]